MFKITLIVCFALVLNCFGDKKLYYNLLNKKVYVGEPGQESKTFLAVVPPIKAEEYVTPESSNGKFS